MGVCLPSKLKKNKDRESGLVRWDPIIVKLADYKVPRKVEFWCELPKTPTGKIDIQKIKQMVQAGLKPKAKQSEPAVVS